MSRTVLVLGFAVAIAGWSPISSIVTQAATIQGGGPDFSASSSPALGIPDDTYDGSLASMACDAIDASAIPAGTLVGSVEIQTAVDHTWIGDLVFKLVSPDGSELGVLSRPGFDEPTDDGSGGFGSSADMDAGFPLNFFDAAPNDAETMGAGLAGADAVCRDGAQLCNFFPNPGAVATPPANFAGFADENASGDWTLCIGDSAGGDVGTLQSWTINIDFAAAGAPALGLSTTLVDFGVVPVGSSSAPETVTIENTGTGSLDLGTLEISGANPADFSLSADTCSGVSLAEAETCTFDVDMSPSVAGGRSAQVDIASNAASSPDSVGLTGTGTEPGLSLDTNNLGFGTVTVGDLVAGSVTVTNTGTTDLTISDISSPGAPFSLAGGSCLPTPTVLVIGANCDIVVEFQPTETGDFNDSFVITSDAPSSPDSVDLSGSAEAGAEPAPAIAVPVNSAWTLTLLAGLLGLIGWFSLRARSIRQSGRDN